MNDNPYSSLLGVMREEGAVKNFTQLILGVVKAPLPNIEIIAGKMPLYKSDLLIDKWLLDRNSFSMYTSCSEHGEENIVDSPKIKDVLKVGDMVLLAKFKNEEKLVIISKVVSL